MKPNGYAIDLKDIQEARDRIQSRIHETPVLTCETINALAHLNLHFKCEVFQKSGAFKIRGATNAVFSLNDADAAKGVITHSSGNHGGALALAAKWRGIPCTVIAPQGTPACKQAAIAGYGAALQLCEASVEGRERACAEAQRASGATFIHPYNSPAVMAGQGTIALEFLEQVEALDTLVVPVSGGGMISGVAVAAKALRPDIKVVAAEPRGTNDMADAAACKAQGQLVQLPSKPFTIADGLQGRLGDDTWPIVRDLVDDVVTIAEDEIVAAMQLVFERMKVVVEPSGAAGLAAVLSTQFRERHPRSRNVGVVLCGGNVDLESVGFWGAWNAKSCV